jgi:hypothetical protein
MIKHFPLFGSRTFVHHLFPEDDVVPGAGRANERRDVPIKLRAPVYIRLREQHRGLLYILYAILRLGQSVLRNVPKAEEENGHD